ncbi:hypothetical protein GGD81_001397 [Rhodobium orientis]|uniref:Uncharacterized protein n=1 Tax=Rhodobium orientis TaxID=34017 RepID=A0A327JJJ1_9HYPH|nr:hypothetical protein [Rhodobium orientis]MBB4302370.1 hypothetical protein [Rhodobium orientis]MBK5949074.1 hypothetical protein [Rhodobium orientis]RAI26600.1 hypothetical protein CH339_13440 [Rhodobium orientis]
MAEEKARSGALPCLPDGAPGKPRGTRYKEQYGVIVVCPDEEAQKAVYEGLRAVCSSKLRVVVT